MINEYETLFKDLETDIKALLPKNAIYWAESDLKNGVRIILEYVGIDEDHIRFNYKICGANCFTMTQIAQIAKLEKDSLVSLPFNKKENQVTNKRQLGENAAYHLVKNKDRAERITKESVNYTRSYDLIITVKG